MLILLHVILMLLMGEAEFNILAAISGKVEIASRYNALQLAFGDRFIYQQPYPDRNNVVDLAAEVEWRFFDDTLDDGQGVVETDDPDVIHYNLTKAELNFLPTNVNNIAWDPILTTLAASDVDLIHGNQVTFDYDLFGFPYHSYELLPDDNVDPGFISAIAPEYSLHGDFVVIGDPFSGDTGEFARQLWLAEAGIATVPPASVLFILYTLFIVPIFLI